jgi:hypothetical protein
MHILPSPSPASKKKLGGHTKSAVTPRPNNYPQFTDPNKDNIEHEHEQKLQRAPQCMTFWF